MTFLVIWRRELQLCFVCLVSIVTSDKVLAVKVTYNFSSTVSFIDPLASGFPGSLSGVSVGAPLTARIQYEASSPAGTNPFFGVYGLATYYPLSNANISVNVDGVLFDSWPGTLAAYVWNNDATSESPPGVFDGLVFSNVTMPNQLQFRIGNTILSTSTFSNEALPSGPVTGIHAVELGFVNGGSWVRSGSGNLTQVFEIPGDYNHDDTVDAADFVTWRDHVSFPIDLSDPQNYDTWRSNFGSQQEAASLSTESSPTATIPEPASVVLFLGALAAFFGAGRGWNRG